MLKVLILLSESHVFISASGMPQTQTQLASVAQLSLWLQISLTTSWLGAYLSAWNISQGSFC